MLVNRIVTGAGPVWCGCRGSNQAFRAFQISEEYQEKYGYPALTDKIKARFWIERVHTLCHNSPPQSGKGYQESGDPKMLKTACLENPQLV